MLHSHRRRRKAAELSELPGVDVDILAFTSISNVNSDNYIYFHFCKADSDTSTSPTTFEMEADMDNYISAFFVCGYRITTCHIPPLNTWTDPLGASPGQPQVAAALRPYASSTYSGAAACRVDNNFQVTVTVTRTHLLSPTETKNKVSQFSRYHFCFRRSHSTCAVFFPFLFKNPELFHKTDRPIIVRKKRLNGP